MVLVAHQHGMINSVNSGRSSALHYEVTKQSVTGSGCGSVGKLSIPTPEIRGLDPDIGKILSSNCTIEKMKIKKKMLGMAHLKKPSLTEIYDGF